MVGRWELWNPMGEVCRGWAGWVGLVMGNGGRGLKEGGA